jgi:hypothetical protein
MLTQQKSQSISIAQGPKLATGLHKHISQMPTTWKGRKHTPQAQLKDAATGQARKAKTRARESAFLIMQLE